jgi:hypothetical protein
VITPPLRGAKTGVHVYGDASPGGGFEAVSPDLEDVYFATMAGHLGRRAAGAGAAAGVAP